MIIKKCFAQFIKEKPELVKLVTISLSKLLKLFFNKIATSPSRAIFYDFSLKIVFKVRKKLELRSFDKSTTQWLKSIRSHILGLVLRRKRGGGISVFYTILKGRVRQWRNL